MTNFKFGITEYSDPSVNYSWVYSIQNVDAAILITKNLTEHFRNKVLELHRAGKPIIVHCTCTGWGGSILEPNIPSYSEQLNNLSRLILAGFPVERVVIRIDPIIPTDAGLAQVKQVLAHAWRNGFKPENTRVRFSIYDEYKHSALRLNQAGYSSFYNGSFYAPSGMMENAKKLLASLPYTFETCAEDQFSVLSNVEVTGCISKKDFNILGLDIPSDVTENPQHRNGCHCLSCKTELIKVSRKQKCPYGCLYCFWKD